MSSAADMSFIFISKNKPTSIPGRFEPPIGYALHLHDAIKLPGIDQYFIVVGRTFSVGADGKAKVEITLADPQHTDSFGYSND